jgi:aldehyde:ferredoxin oxidoreductase
VTTHKRLLCTLGRKAKTMINWEQQFPIAEINRADLTEFDLTDEQIETIFTDEKMKDIADRMQTSYYMDHLFWDNFKQAIKEVTGIDVSEADITLRKE